MFTSVLLTALSVVGMGVGFVVCPMAQPHKAYKFWHAIAPFVLGVVSLWGAVRLQPKHQSEGTWEMHPPLERNQEWRMPRPVDK